MTVITMSRKELARLQTLIGLADGRIDVDDASALMGLGRRQTYRLLEAFRAGGADALISKRRGRPSNRTHGAVFRQTVLDIVRDRYGDFGPTLAAEKLLELHGLPVGTETLRQWMIEAGMWVRRRDRLKRVHQPRHRRDCLKGWICGAAWAGAAIAMGVAISSAEKWTVRISELLRCYFSLTKQAALRLQAVCGVRR